MARMKQGVFSWEDVLAQRYQSCKPVPLQHRRRSTSTIESSAQQPGCRLLSLSPELRLMIWESALGGLRLHIIQRSPQRLGCIICPLSTPRAGEPFCEICQGGGIPQPAKEADLVRAGRGGNGIKLLALALTCRQIYLESTHLLYKLNTFEFSNPWTLPYFHPTLPLESWERIQSIELRWAFPGHWLPTKDPVRAVYVTAGRAQWLETCRTLNRLPALRSFILVLGSSWFNEPVEKLPIFLEPLRGLQIRRSQRYVLSAIPSQAVPSEISNMNDASGESARHILTKTSPHSPSLSPTSSSGACVVRPLVSNGVVSDISAPLALPTWELRLQGQPYYLHELGRVGVDLRRRGIDCDISMV